MVNFKQIITSLDSQIPNESNNIDKIKLFNDSKEYILIRSLIEDIHQVLNENETFEGYIPLTNTDNTSVFSSGYLGASYAKKPETQEYIKQFKDIRGNRLLIFTSNRILFIILADFLETQIYMSYSYDNIKGIKLKKKKLRSFRTKCPWYLFDFQSNNNIFTETFTEDNFAKFMSLREKIPKLKSIKLTDKTIRKNLFDLIFSDVSLFIKIGYFVSFLFVLLAIFVVFYLIKMFYF